MEEKIILDMLTSNGVSLKKQKYVTVDGTEYLVGELWTKAYTNSIEGRAEVESEVTEPYKSAIMAMWGDNPTIIETVAQ